MTTPPTTESADDQPIQCLLELHYDGTVVVTAKRGCTNEEIRDLLSQLASGTWLDRSAATPVRDFARPADDVGTNAPGLPQPTDTALRLSKAEVLPGRGLSRRHVRSGAGGAVQDRSAPC